ncbi:MULTISPECIES: glycosyltransferase family 61 protein [unclassified Lysobacter]|uniref:glycosyltransferase family 61 protein n=1 Tax=unclassified Lysobacter TaxID=2635362 RepID=UPI001BE9BE99|nr:MULTISPECIES: glycosyltransferase family 61 protein [unclassified Lysobacter]MBT2748984.1 glycosyltransferase family 61 protein [Lysobacter sp. ISL-42]MBT2751434.1 glycosyltransferase family 61 protein [Lysobacter sp. ISL-50]MBT2778257.1 glycosyltransferase family 61 protein [Lysobacter sp. ISL-54]MBT2782696.1 glycosyltransferase family 61 protein [Lysobacter sp. ISL-52]
MTQAQATQELELVGDPRKDGRWRCLLEGSSSALCEQKLLFDDDPFGLERRIPKLPARIDFESFLLRLEGGEVLDGLRNIVSDDAWFVDRVLPQKDGPADLLRCDLRSGMRLEDGAIRFVPRPVDRIDAEIGLAVSNEPSNWGSYLCRILPKIIRFGEMGLDRILAYCGGPQRLDLFDLIGLSRERIVPHDPGRNYTCASALYMSEPTNSLYLEPSARADLARLADRFRAWSGRRLYVSRRAGLGARSGRTCLNEQALESELRALGVEIIHPDQLNVRQQITAFANASLIIGCSGAGMFNTVFAPRDAVVIEIESSPNWSYAHTSLFSSLGLRHGFVWGLPVSGHGSAPHVPFEVDVAAVCNRVKDYA